MMAIENALEVNEPGDEPPGRRELYLLDMEEQTMSHHKTVEEDFKIWTNLAQQVADGVISIDDDELKGVHPNEKLTQLTKENERLEYVIEVGYETPVDNTYMIALDVDEESSEEGTSPEKVTDETNAFVDKRRKKRKRKNRRLQEPLKTRRY